MSVLCLGNGMGMGNPHGSGVQVLAGMGAGQEYLTHTLNWTRDIPVPLL
jgi:hypothetical protein